MIFTCHRECKNHRHTHSRPFRPLQEQHDRLFWSGKCHCSSGICISVLQCRLFGVQTCKSDTKFVPASCGKASPSRKPSPQLAGRQVRAEKPSSNLEHDKVAPQLLPPSWRATSPHRKSFLHLGATFFGSAMQISPVGHSLFCRKYPYILIRRETAAWHFRRILLQQSRSLYSLHIRASANMTSLLR